MPLNTQPSETSWALFTKSHPIWIRFDRSNKLNRKLSGNHPIGWNKVIPCFYRFPVEVFNAIEYTSYDTVLGTTHKVSSHLDRFSSVKQGVQVISPASTSEPVFGSIGSRLILKMPLDIQPTQTN
jgi:hypothetical protein